jgi:hypothetical protein
MQIVQILVTLFNVFLEPLLVHLLFLVQALLKCFALLVLKQPVQIMLEYAELAQLQVQIFLFSV